MNTYPRLYEQRGMDASTVGDEKGEYAIKRVVGGKPLWVLITAKGIEPSPGATKPQSNNGQVRTRNAERGEQVLHPDAIQISNDLDRSLWYTLKLLDSRFQPASQSLFGAS